MLIDFAKIPETSIKSFYGGEKELLTKMYTDEHARIMKIKLVPGASVGLHKHETSSEIVFVLEGTGTAIYDGQKEKLQAGICVVQVPPQQRQPCQCAHPNRGP